MASSCNTCACVWSDSRVRCCACWCVWHNRWTWCQCGLLERLRMRQCARYNGSTCGQGRMRDPPDIRGRVCRESNGADIGWQPCSAALQGLFYHIYAGVVRSSPSGILELSVFLACAECAL